MFYTYSIKNIENGKFYIGSRTTKCMLNRKPEDDLGIKYFSSSKDKELRQAIKDGKVEYHILQEYDDADICWKAEQQLIALYWKFFGKDKSYNKRCDIENITVWSTGGHSNPQQSIRMNGNKYFENKHHSNETKQKLSKANKGKKCSNETKQKISTTLTGRQFSDNHREKISKALTGRQFSEETRYKLSIIKKGKHLSEEHKQKISKSNRGKSHSNKGMPSPHKGMPQQKFYWQTLAGETKIMDKANAHRFHPDWTLIGPVENNENN